MKKQILILALLLPLLAGCTAKHGIKKFTAFRICCRSEEVSAF